MPKNYLLVGLLSCLLAEVASAKSLVDCRVLSSNSIVECNPYGSKLLRVTEVKDSSNNKKLILSKKTSTLKTSNNNKKRTLVILPPHESVEIDSTTTQPTFWSEPIKVADKTDGYKIKKDQSVSHEMDTNTPKDTEVLWSEEKPDSKETETYVGFYSVVGGDVLGRIAHKFSMTTKSLLLLNLLDKNTTLNIGQKVKIPLSQKMVDAIASAEYTIESGDTLLKIAHTFDVSPKLLVKFNHLKSAAHIREGKTLALPLPYIMKQVKIAEKKEQQKQARIKKEGEEKAQKLRLAQKTKDASKKKRKLYLKKSGKRKLRVTATAYSSHVAQTDSTPFLAAWNNRLRPGMKIIAVSRDLLTRYGLRNGTRVRIGGLRGYYRVRDKMNKRYKKRIDIYMGLNRKRALRWGKRSVVIYW